MPGLRLLLAAALLPGAGCHVDIVRFRSGTPLDRAEYEKLEVGKTTRAEAVDKLGAPDRLEWKGGDDYLWYLYTDTVDTGVRFQFPPFRSIFGYQHTFLRLDENSEATNALALVFDENRILERKSLRISDAYQPAREDLAGWKIHLTPHVDHSVLLQGDAGIEDYGDAFENGYRVGLDLGFQPVPVVTLLVASSFQEHQGKSFRRGGARVSLDDLQLYQMEIGIRLAAPLSLLYSFPDFETVKRILFEDDLSRSQGLRFYLQGTTGVTVNGNVPVKVNGTRRGNFYDSDPGFSGTLEAGLEYGWKWGEAHVGITYESIDPFNEGSSGLDDEGGAFQAVLLGGGVGVKF